MSTDLSANNNNNDTENEHLLEHSWVLWYRPPTKNNAPGNQWEVSQQSKFVAETVEGFWRGFRQHPRLAGHPLNCDYSLFKKGIKPMWEDEFNEKGGRWTYTIERRPQGFQSIAAAIEQAWLDMMLCLIGEGFDPYGDQVAGGVCGIRSPKGQKSEPMCAKLHVWTKDATNEEANMEIGKRLKEVLHSADGQLTYTPHDMSSSGGAGRRGYSMKL